MLASCPAAVHHVACSKTPGWLVALQFIVNDTKKYNYNGEIEEKLKDMGRPNLVRIRQKQACLTMAFMHCNHAAMY